MNIQNTALDSLAEPMSLASADTGLASPLAEVAAQAAPEPLTAAMIDATVAQPVATPHATLATPMPLGTLAPATSAATLPMLGALLLVVGLILVLGKLVKKLQSARGVQGSTLQVKAGLQVGGKERVVWMQAGDTHLLLGVSPGRVETLHVFDVPPDFAAFASPEPSRPAAATAPVAAATPASRDFSERLKTLLAHAKAKGLDIETAAAETVGVTVETSLPKQATAASSPPAFSFRA